MDLGDTVIQDSDFEFSWFRLIAGSWDAFPWGNFNRANGLAEWQQLEKYSKRSSLSQSASSSLSIWKLKQGCFLAADARNMHEAKMFTIIYIHAWLLQRNSITIFLECKTPLSPLKEWKFGCVLYPKYSPAHPPLTSSSHSITQGSLLPGTASQVDTTIRKVLHRAQLVSLPKWYLYLLAYKQVGQKLRQVMEVQPNILY